MSLFKNLFSNNSFGRGLERARADADGVILDVRTREEYLGGHIPGAVNVPLDEIEYADLDASKHYYVYCRSGARSGAACSVLAQDGFRAENIGGIQGYRGETVKGEQS